MIFSRLFKKKKDEVVDQVDTPDAGVQASALPQKYTGDATLLTKQSGKKTKTDKKNTALRKGWKRRSQRTVHTKRSFHRGNRRPTGEMVHIYDVIDAPVITEKSANQSENGVYTFLVRDDANKYTVADAVEVLYGVRPKKFG